MEKITLTHTLYGAGEQVSLSDTVIRVRFADGTERSFVYPDAFLKFLTYTDDARERAVRALLDERREAAEEEARRAAQRRADSLEAARTERLRLAAEKKRAASRARRPAAAKSEA